MEYLSFACVNPLCVSCQTNKVQNIPCKFHLDMLTVNLCNKCLNAFQIFSNILKTIERGWTLASFERIMYEQFEEIISLHFRETIHYCAAVTLHDFSIVPQIGSIILFPGRIIVCTFSLLWSLWPNNWLPACLNVDISKSVNGKSCLPVKGTRVLVKPLQFKAARLLSF